MRAKRRCPRVDLQNFRIQQYSYDEYYYYYTFLYKNKLRLLREHLRSHTVGVLKKWKKKNCRWRNLTIRAAESVTAEHTGTRIEGGIFRIFFSPFFFFTVTCIYLYAVLNVSIRESQTFPRKYNARIIWSMSPIRRKYIFLRLQCIIHNNIYA